MSRTNLATAPRTDLLELRAALTRAMPRLKFDRERAWANWYAANESGKARAHREYLGAICAIIEVRNELTRVNRALVFRS